ncbi:MAG: hypothetical protein MI974_10795 [Chitinophagales bacterium]|nr:hypothetical protein [Chitinophagales bacterium]
MTLIDNKMIHCLFNIAQYLNKFNSGETIQADVKESLQEPLATYHQQKDDYQKVLADNSGDEPVTKPDHLALAQKALKDIKINAILDQPKVVDCVNDLNTFLKDQLADDSDPVIADDGENGGDIEDPTDSDSDDNT